MYSNNDYRYYKSDELYHHGILGQKWGRRRYQNEDGSLTDAGRTHYGKGNKLTKAIGKGLKKFGEEYTHDHSLEAEYERKKAERDMRNSKIIRNAQRTKNAKGVSGKIDEFIGAGSKRTDYEEEAKYHDRMARTYKNKNLRKQHEIAAQNARIKADYEAKRSKQYQKGGLNAAKQAGHDFIFGDSDRMNMKYITTSGRESTRGKEALRSAIFSTILDVAIDNIVGAYPPSSEDGYERNNRNYVNAFSDNYKQAKKRYRNK